MEQCSIHAITDNVSKQQGAVTILRQISVLDNGRIMSLKRETLATFGLVSLFVVLS